MSGYVIQPTGDPPFVTCNTCDGRGYTTALKWGLDPDWCPECGGAAEVALDMSRLATLAHNLAIGAALCRSFTLGSGIPCGPAQRIPRSTGVASIPDEDWRPGCRRQAP